MAYLIHDQKGITHTPGSFHATLRDWARIGLHIMDERRTPTGDCYNRFVEKASTTQIQNQSKSFGDDLWLGRSFQLKFNTSGTQVVDFIGNRCPIADYKAGLDRFSGVGSANSKAANSDF